MIVRTVYVNCDCVGDVSAWVVWNGGTHRLGQKASPRKVIRRYGGRRWRREQRRDQAHCRSVVGGDRGQPAPRSLDRRPRHRRWHIQRRQHRLGVSGHKNLGTVVVLVFRGAVGAVADRREGHGR